MDHDISDIGLADGGRRRIEWAWSEMPVLRRLHARFTAQAPLAGVTVSGCLHITTETANLARVPKAAGADRVLCASNPLSTQDDVAAALVRDLGIPVFARCGEDNARCYRHFEAARASDVIITATGDKHVIDRRHLAVMKDGCVIGNSGHFNVEINIPTLTAMASECHRPRPHSGSERYRTIRSAH